MNTERQQIITGVDIGTTMTRVLIAEVLNNAEFKVLGFGITQNKGLKKGIVESVTKSAESVEKAIEIAEQQAGVEVENIIVGITGHQIRGINNTGVITVNSPGTELMNEREITQSDINRVLEHTKAVTLPADRSILHVLPQEFNVDDHKGIKDPLGMIGHRLEASVHLVTSDVRNEKNIRTCLRNAGLDIKQFVLNPLASAESTLDPNEKNLGAAVVDIGGGTTDVIVYHNNGVRHTGIVPIGSNNITSDIAHGLQTTFEQAEELKKNYGCAKSALASDEKNIKVEGIGGRDGRLISQKELAQLIEPRLVEILAMASAEIKKKDNSRFLTFGVILTGGGSLLHNTSDLAIDVFQQPIKIANPIITGGFGDILENPESATVLGLIQYEMNNKDSVIEEESFFEKIPGIDTVIGKVKNVFKNLI